jgi:hypothetical protein
MVSAASCCWSGRHRALVGWMAASNLMLMLATWKLWWPSIEVEFPLVPLWPPLAGLPSWVTQLLTTVCLLGLCGLGVAAILPGKEQRRWRGSVLRLCSGLVLGSGLLLVGMNQHRFQPWFYQLLVFCSLWGIAGEGVFVRLSSSSYRLFAWFQAIIISVYFHSSLGKLDFQFLHTVGQQFLGAIFAIVGADISVIDWSVRLLLAAAFPLGEWILAVGLLACWWWRSRWLFGCGMAAVVFHLALAWILGYQLQHSLGVVLWNVQFVGLAVILFMHRSQAVQRATQSASVASMPTESLPPPVARRPLRERWQLRLAAVVSLAVICLPLGERWGYWDHWPSWALYAPHSSRVELMVAPQAVKKLPASLRGLMVEEEMAADEMGWQRVPLPRWSLEQLAAPIYPQARFQMQVARDLARRIDSPFQVQVIVLGPAGRIHGRRTEKLLRGTDEILRYR